MSPILLRPVREQLEHDRVIRLLQARWKRRYQVAINPGTETNASVGTGEAATYPDVMLTPPGSRKPEVVVEVETGESVNRMEALFEWARLAQQRAAFHLFVPAGSVEAARRLCQENAIQVSEIWTYHQIGEQIRFTQVYRAPAAPHARPVTERRVGARGAGKRSTGAGRAKASRKPATRTGQKRHGPTRPAGSSQKKKRTPVRPTSSRAARTSASRRRR